MANKEEALSRMRFALQQTDPEWDIAPGTAEYKILEAVAREIESIGIDSVIKDYHFDIDTKIGIDLDKFVAMFGFYRFPAKRASGIVSIGRATNAPRSYSVPIGTQVYVPATTVTPATYFQTTVSAVLPQGSRSVDLPITAVVPGTSGNVSSGSIISAATDLEGISVITNALPTDGGRDVESDEELRRRWKRTVFRNISGTEDQFLGLAFNEPEVSRANVVGPIERYQEQINLNPPTNSGLAWNSTPKPWNTTLDSDIPAPTTLSGAMTISTTSITVTSGTGLAAGDHIWVDKELILLSGAGPTTFTATRGQEGTNITAHANGSAAIKATIEVADDTLADPGTYILIKNTTPNPDDYYLAKILTKSASGLSMVVHPSAPWATSVLTGETIEQAFISNLPDAKNVWTNGGEFLGLNLGTPLQTLGLAGVHYNIYDSQSTDPNVLIDSSWVNILSDFNRVFPIFTIISDVVSNSSGIKLFPPDSVIELDFEYTPSSSRNEPNGTPAIMDKVDIFIDGDIATNVTEDISFSNIKFGTTINDPFPAETFIKDDDTSPSDQNYYVPLSRVPLMTVPESITVQPYNSRTTSTTYYLNQDYWIVKDNNNTSNYQGSIRATEGLEWLDTTIVTPPTIPVLSTNLANNGLKAGSYAYVYTYVVDGVESLPSPSATVVVDGTHRKVAIDLAISGAGGTVWRKIYRTRKDQQTSGEYFLVTTIKENDTEHYTDGKEDKKLGDDYSPPQTVPDIDTPIQITYNFDQLVANVDGQVNLTRLVGMDTLVHEINPVFTKINLAIVPRFGVNALALKDDIYSALGLWLNSKGFHGDVQVADIVDTVSSINGVDNVRLINSAEGRNAVQRISLMTDGATDVDADYYTLFVGRYDSDEYETPAIEYTDNTRAITDALEALPNINAGNDRAGIVRDNIGLTDTTIKLGKMAIGATSDSIIAGLPGFNDNPRFVNFQPFYLVVRTEEQEVLTGDEAEIVKVTAISDLQNDGADYYELTVERAQFGSEQSIHTVDNTVVVDVPGDVAVFKEYGLGTSGDPFVIDVVFLPNQYDGTNNWGARTIPLMTAVGIGQLSDAGDLEVTDKVVGRGSGIQRLSRSGLSISSTHYSDFYLNNNEIPYLFDVEISPKARNSF